MKHRIHPLARQELANIALPRPVVQYRAGLTERLYTNPFGGDFCEYPCPLPLSLQQNYAEIVNAANRLNPFPCEGIELMGENILFTAGSIMGIDLLIRAFCFPGKDTICITPPTFGGYMQYAKVNLAEVKQVPLLGENLDVIDIDKILSVLPKILFLCVPSNPIGTCISKSLILEILDRAQCLVVIDEAYIELADVPSTTSLVSRYPNLAVLRTFSKGWGLAGIRAGVVVASPEILTALRRIQDPFSMSLPIQRTLKAAFLNLPKIQGGFSRVIASRERMEKRLKSYSFIEKVFSSNTNFILAKLARTNHLLDDIDNSNCLIEKGPNEVPISIRISVGDDVDQNELFNFLDQYARD